MAEYLPGLPRPRTLAHPGPVHGVRIDHVRADRSRHFRLSLTAGDSLHRSLVEPLRAAGVHSASMTLIDGALDELWYCTPQPGTGNGPVAGYGAPRFERSARLIAGNATLGQSDTGAPVVHCHAVFRLQDGSVRGGHVVADKSLVGADPITVLATALDGIELRIGHDEETGMPLLRPHAKVPHG